MSTWGKKWRNCHNRGQPRLYQPNLADIIEVLLYWHPPKSFTCWWKLCCLLCWIHTNLQMQEQMSLWRSTAPGWKIVPPGQTVLHPFPTSLLSAYQEDWTGYNFSLDLLGKNHHGEEWSKTIDWNRQVVFRSEYRGVRPKTDVLPPPLGGIGISSYRVRQDILSSYERL